VSGADISVSGEHDVIAALREGLRADVAVQAVLGNPARVYDDETPGPAYPYAVIERHESRAANGANTRGLEHTVQIVTYSRHGGAYESKRLLGALRVAVQALEFDLPDQRMILVIPTYCDAMRTKNQYLFRGVLRVRILTEELSL